MRKKALYPILGGMLMVLLMAGPSTAIESFCPTDTDGDGFSDDPNVECMHVAGGDGLSMMADGHPLYMFGFTDVTGVPDGEVMSAAMLGANLPSPLIDVNEGQVLYLTLSNYGMMLRPDLFDPHTVHWHGFPQASAFYDGVPDLSVAVNMGGSLTYYYKVPAAGTYLWHCHVEATEHIQMGMIGNLVVRPAQNGTSIDGFTQFAYNDGDGTTGYDVEKIIQLTDFDGQFHDASRAVQPLPFAALKGEYFLMNGRGYPDTASAADVLNEMGYAAQNADSLITCTAGQTILLRFANLSVDSFHTVECLGIPMKVVGKDAKLLRGPLGADLTYMANSFTIGGGESIDVILDTTGITPGTYYLFSRNLYALNNNEEPRGGMMTEIIVNP